MSLSGIHFHPVEDKMDSRQRLAGMTESRHPAFVIRRGVPFLSVTFSRTHVSYQVMLNVDVATMEEIMLWTIAVVLMVLWLLGLVSSYTLGGFVHLLLVAAVIVVLIRVIQGRPVLKG